MLLKIVEQCRERTHSAALIFYTPVQLTTRPASVRHLEWESTTLVSLRMFLMRNMFIERCRTNATKNEEEK